MRLRSLLFSYFYTCSACDAENWVPSRIQHLNGLSLIYSWMSFIGVVLCVFCYINRLKEYNTVFQWYQWLDKVTKNLYNIVFSTNKCTKMSCLAHVYFGFLLYQFISTVKDDEVRLN